MYVTCCKYEYMYSDGIIIIMFKMIKITNSINIPYVRLIFLITDFGVYKHRAAELLIAHRIGSRIGHDAAIPRHKRVQDERHKHGRALGQLTL